MKTMKIFIQHIKEWWHENKRVIGAGIACGALGYTYGLFTGAIGTNQMWLDSGLGQLLDKSTETPGDELGLTEENCDDPEYAEVVNMENNENS